MTEPMDQREDLHKLRKESAERCDERAAIIEECARIADRNGRWILSHKIKGFQLLNRGRNDAAKTIAAEIRALASEDRPTPAPSSPPK